METVMEEKVKSDIIDTHIEYRHRYYPEGTTYLSNKAFFSKRIEHGQGESAVMLTKVAVLVGLGLIEKYGLDRELSNTVAQSQYEIVCNISVHNNDFFAKAFFHRSNPYEPVGVMFGNFIPDIQIAVSSILYVKPEFRIYNLESRLIDNFIWWGKNEKRTNKVFIERAEEV